jgi:hypothetical protein
MYGGGSPTRYSAVCFLYKKYLTLALLSDAKYLFAAKFLSGKDADGRRKPNKERNE